MKRVQIDHPNLYEIDPVNLGNVLECILDFNTRNPDPNQEWEAKVVFISLYDFEKLNKPDIHYYKDKELIYPIRSSCPIMISRSLLKGKIWVSNNRYNVPK